MTTPRCIDCRNTFNRAKAEDKLRCPACTKVALTEEVKPGQRTLREQLEDRARRKDRDGRR